ncbi:hypothetical protein IEN85_21320 [Pelagicoccus sp. NFK12]|uniref:Uncharacterized protein n=1 Tax=Pelagicoccus enzymogenes TaxID=2773457 RepID=A0A927IJQ6_9BACT|nr:hypothetical protein [Pelagicoccus enzymogenes]MBD5782053.1 hypothetical protein [Pelagicoccus enzymogenes]
MTQLRENNPSAAVCNLAWLDFFSNEDDWKNDLIDSAFFNGACQRASSQPQAAETSSPPTTLSRRNSYPKSTISAKPHAFGLKPTGSASFPPPSQQS